MSDEDPVDDVLRRAFTADRAATPPMEVAASVMAGIRTRERLRAAVLGIGALLGLVAVSLWLGPALEALTEAFAGALPDRWHDHGLLLGVLAVIGATAVMLLEEETA